MFSQEMISDFLRDLEICEVCILRYTHKLDFNSIYNKSESIENDNPKKKRANPCVACLGLFQSIDSISIEIVNNSNLACYDSKSLYTSISIPITLLMRELSVWMALIKQFPGRIDCGKKNLSKQFDMTLKSLTSSCFNNNKYFAEIPPNLSIKDAIKQILNNKLCKATNREIEIHQNGVLVNLFYEYKFEQEEIEKLLLLTPITLKNISGNRKMMQRNMSRNFFEKHFFPTNLDAEACRLSLPIPPNVSSTTVYLARYTIEGPKVSLFNYFIKPPS